MKKTKSTPYNGKSNFLMKPNYNGIGVGDGSAGSSPYVNSATHSYSIGRPRSTSFMAPGPRFRIIEESQEDSIDDLHR